MELEMLRTLIKPEVLILIPVLYVIGILLRQTPNVPDWIDVWVKFVIGIIGAVMITQSYIDGFIQGVLVSGGATLIKDMVSRTSEGVQEYQLNKNLPDGVKRDPETGEFISKEEYDRKKEE